MIQNLDSVFRSQDLGPGIREQGLRPGAGVGLLFANFCVELAKGSSASCWWLVGWVTKS